MTQSTATSTPLVLIHGLLGSSRNLKSWAQLLLKHLDGVADTVILLDVVNHGGSVKHGPLSMRYEDMCEDVLFTLSEMGINECHLLGHSLGGKLAACTALRSVQAAMSSRSSLNIKSLVMLDISPVAYSPEDFSTVLNTVNFLVQTKSEIAKSVTKKDVSKILAREIHDPSLAAFLLSSIGDVVCPLPPKATSLSSSSSSSPPLTSSGEVCAPSTTLGWKFLLDGIHPSLDAIMGFPSDVAAHGPFNKPTLVYKGAKSPFVRSKHIETISTFFPSYFLLSEKDSGHWLHHEKPDETTTKVAKFLKTVAQQ